MKTIEETIQGMLELPDEILAEGYRIVGGLHFTDKPENIKYQAGVMREFLFPKNEKVAHVKFTTIFELFSFLQSKLQDKPEFPSKDEIISKSICDMDMYKELSTKEYHNLINNPEEFHKETCLSICNWLKERVAQ